MAGSDLLLQVEYVKFRSSGASRSPIGTFFVFEDRVEWTEKDGSEKLVISFSDIKGQRVSPPNKTKTQLQLVLYNNEQHTFAFVNPTGGKEEHVKERDLVKETLQQSLIRHRQIANQEAARSLKYSRTHEMEAKKKILAENKHVQQLYKHLVSSKLISAQDFWGEYYQVLKFFCLFCIQKGGDDEEKPGVSGGFLSNIAQSEGVSGVRLNLNVDTIQSIFKTYPAVERKHLELVPHEMTEQQFWSKFFQSHYFHRERAINPSLSDPFSDCVKTDDAGYCLDMKKLLEAGVTKKSVDFDHLSDDLDIFKVNNSVVQDGKMSNLQLLVKRCNYHSGRVLLTTKENTISEQGDASHSLEKNFSDPASDELRLESDELRWDDDEADDDEQILLGEEETNVFPESDSIQNMQHYTDIVAKVSEKPVFMEDCDLIKQSQLLEPVLNEELNRNDVSQSSLDSSDSVELQIVCDSLAELLKHFWMCFPLHTSALQKKLDRMFNTLKNFESNQLAEAEQRFGAYYLKHCHYMLGLAFNRYEAVLRKRKKVAH
uniref:BSD domain-containing protein n=1 Tax=Syphacia muris TaxID=451379 RepID=A0A0N5APV7_9BILA